MRKRAVRVVFVSAKSSILNHAGTRKLAACEDRRSRQAKCRRASGQEDGIRRKQALRAMMMELRSVRVLDANLERPRIVRIAASLRRHPLRRRIVLRRLRAQEAVRLDRKAAASRPAMRIRLLATRRILQRLPVLHGL